MNEDNEHKPKLVILDVGRQKRKSIEDLKQGIGQLADEVRDAAQTATEVPGTGGKEIVPVVILYRKRGQKRRSLFAEILRNL
jgi:hypothetical protein